MARYIDADALECDTEWSDYHDGFISYSQLEIDTAPSIDIVRCSECNHYTEAEGCLLEDNSTRQADDFCSYGERKESK